MTEFKLKNGCGRFSARGCGRQDNKLNTYDWLADIPAEDDHYDRVEVQFKNTRKGYYKNSNKLKLEKGDIVAVEASPGHDESTSCSGSHVYLPRVEHISTLDICSAAQRAFLLPSL